jgi:hypothetical protein
MSRRITTQTQIKDKKLAISALKTAGWNYDESGDHLTITSGPMRNSMVDLHTGVVTGDSDIHRSNELGSLRKFYAEAAYKQALNKTGATVESREIMKDGRIRLVCSGNLA